MCCHHQEGGECEFISWIGLNMFFVMTKEYKKNQKYHKEKNKIKIKSKKISLSWWIQKNQKLKTLSRNSFIY